MPSLENIVVEIGETQKDKVLVNGVLKTNGNLKKRLKVNLILILLMFVAVTLVGARYLYKIEKDNKLEDRAADYYASKQAASNNNTQLSGEQPLNKEIQPAVSGNGNDPGSSIIEHIIGVLLSSVTALLGGGSFLTAVKSCFSSDDDSDTRGPVNDKKLEDLMNKINIRNKRLLIVKYMYLGISILGFFFFVVFIVITLKNIFFAKSSSKSPECNDFIECWDLMKGLNLTISVDMVVCRDVIAENVTDFTTKLNYCQQIVMGCDVNNPGFFQIYNETEGFYATSAVRTYFINCSSGSLLDINEGVAWLITSIGIFSTIHCACIYYILSSPGCLKSKNKFILLCSPILLFNLSIVGLVPCCFKAEDSGVKDVLDENDKLLQLTVLRNVLAEDEEKNIRQCLGHIEKLGKKYKGFEGLKDLIDHLEISEVQEKAPETSGKPEKK